MDNQKEKTWFITGASKGIGFALVTLLLENGHKVAATSRNKKSIEEKIGKNNPNLLTLTVDITNDNEVRQAINETVNKFGKIDVAVNNAGYLLLGSLEEVSAKEFQQSLNVNVIAFLNVIRNVLPYFRKQKSGHIFNFSSSAGYSADAGAGSYNAVKSTVIAFSEALAAEVKPYNVKVTIVSPGFFRTSFLEKDAFSIAQNRIEDYNTQLLIDGMGQMSGNQTGDPEKLVKILMNIEGTEDAPLHLLMGQDAYERATNYYKSQLAALEKHKDLSFSTNFN